MRLVSCEDHGACFEPNTHTFFTGYNWDEDLLKNYRVQLKGFSTSETNTIKIFGLQNGISVFGPDIDRIGVVG